MTFLLNTMLVRMSLEGLLKLDHLRWWLTTLWVLKILVHIIGHHIFILPRLSSVTLPLFLFYILMSIPTLFMSIATIYRILGLNFCMTLIIDDIWSNRLLVFGMLRGCMAFIKIILALILWFCTLFSKVRIRIEMLVVFGFSKIWGRVFTRIFFNFGQVRILLLQFLHHFFQILSLPSISNLRNLDRCWTAILLLVAYIVSTCLNLIFLLLRVFLALRMFGFYKTFK